MRGTSDCCHYDEGYDEGYADGKEEVDDKAVSEAIKNTLLAVRVLVEEGEEIPTSLTPSEVEEIVDDELRRNSRMVHRYREALAR